MTYEELETGRIYVTSYEGQGDYTFIFGNPNAGAINNESDCKCHRTSGNQLHPPNGFFEFRLPTNKELEQFSLYLNSSRGIVPLDKIEAISYQIF